MKKEYRKVTEFKTVEDFSEYIKQENFNCNNVKICYKRGLHYHYYKKT